MVTQHVVIVYEYPEFHEGNLQTLQEAILVTSKSLRPGFPLIFPEGNPLNDSG